MENAIEALGIACTALLLALALSVLINLSESAKAGERFVMKNVLNEWLIVGGEGKYE